MAPVVVSEDTNQRVTNLLHRLEAATSRLEDIASSTIEIPQAVPALKETLASPDASSKAIADAPAQRAAAPATEPLPESIEDFDAFLKSSVENFSKLSKAIGGVIAEQAAKVVHGFEEERKFLLITTKAKKPDMGISDDVAAYQKLLKPINESIIAVGNIKESNRGSPDFNELNAVAEGTMVLAWVMDDRKPHKHVDDTLGSAQYWGNRVIKDNKDKNPQHVEWIQSFYQIVRDLSEYIKQYFPSGIPWNPQGEPVQDVVKVASTSAAPASAPAPPPPAAGGPPPPPPPGPPPVLQIKEQKNAPKPAAGGLDAVFSELNKGEAVTAGLRKVDRSEMTHKNPSLRASSTVSDASRGKSPAPGKKPKPESMRAKKPPVKTFEGNKWTIENFEKEANPIEIEASLSHSILISRCNNATIVVKGKANAVTIDNTNRLNLIVDTLVSSVDVVKSQNFALQVMGTIPTVMMDSVDGAQVYFSKESTSTKIIHSKSAGINLNVISGPDDDYVEVPLPGQITSYYDPEKKALVDEIVSHAG